MRPDSLGVIGLGAIGGSVAWQAARAGVRRVIGFSLSPKEGAAAARAGAIHEVATSLRHVLERADLVVFAAPPAATIALLARWGRMLRDRGALMTDVTSVKRPVMAVAARHDLGAAFAGSHPFAGTHAQGFTAARPDLFRNAVVYVTAAAGGDRAAREVADFWEGVCEAQPVRLEADDHDRRMAATSHLPQVVASALAATLARQARHGRTVGPGARDTTRLAAGSIEMWRDLLVLNRDHVLAALDVLEDELGSLRRALADGDADQVAHWLAVGARWRRSVG
jgi:prephenate dehydrogenase